MVCFAGGPFALRWGYNGLERHLVVLHLNRVVHFLFSPPRWEEGSEGLQEEAQGEGGGARKGSPYKPQVLIVRPFHPLALSVPQRLLRRSPCRSGANSCCRSEAFSTAAAAQDFCATAAAEDLSGAGGAGDFALPASDFFSRKAMELYQTERGLSWSG